MFSLYRESNCGADFSERFGFPMPRVILPLLCSHLSSGTDTANCSSEELSVISLCDLRCSLECDVGHNEELNDLYCSPNTVWVIK